MHEIGVGGAGAARAGAARAGAARAGAVVLAAILTLPASWFVAIPVSASQRTASHAAAGPPPAMGHFSKISVPGGTQVQPESISDAGVIVGCYEAKTSERAFIDRHGKISTFADPAVKGKHGVTCALGIDDKGAIVGDYRSAGSAVHGFVDRNGNFSTVHVPISPQSHPAALVLNGIADDGTISGLTGTTQRLRSFIERAGKVTTIAVPGGFGTLIACISEHGRFAVGIFRPTRKPRATQIGFTYRTGVYRSLRDPSAPRGTVPQCGNAAGFVVGYLFNARGIASQGFLFTPAKAAG